MLCVSLKARKQTTRVYQEIRSMTELSTLRSFQRYLGSRPQMVADTSQGSHHSQLKPKHVFGQFSRR